MTHQHPEIDQQLYDLALAVDVPEVDPAADLTRGRGHVRRRRAAAAVAALATAAVAGLTAVAVAGDHEPGGGPVVAGPSVSDSLPAGATTTAPTSLRAVVDTRDAKQLLTDWRGVVADHLDPGGEHLEKVPTNVQSGGGLGTKLGWANRGEEGLGMVQVFVSRTWAGQFSMRCDPSQHCRDVRVGGVTGRVMESGGETSVGVQHPEGFVVVIGVDALFGNNSTVPVAGLDVSVADLVRTAADDRFSMPTREQIDHAGASFGFPD